MMLAPPQTSVPLGPNHSQWYESIQDMSGYVTQDTTLPQLDEQLTLSRNTAQYENDIYVQNTGLAEFCLGDTSEGVSDDSDMFDCFISSTFDSKINECRIESPIKQGLYDMHSDNIRSTANMGDMERNFPQQKILLCLPKAKVSTVKKEKPRYLELIDSEEPLIKEDPDLLYCAEYKMDVDTRANVNVPEELNIKEDPHSLYCTGTQKNIDFDVKANVDVSEIFSSEETSSNEDEHSVYCVTDFKDMGVAEEVVVITEEDNCKTNLNVSLLDCVLPDSEEELIIPDEKEKKDLAINFKSDPFSGFENVIEKLFNGMEQIGDDIYTHFEDDFYVSPATEEKNCPARHSISSMNELFGKNTNNVIPEANDLFNSTTSTIQLSDQPTTLRLFSDSTDCQISQRNAPKHVPLTLDIDAARAALLDEKGVSDTPELLEALEPEVGKFDLIKFITSNGDPNNNAISPVVESQPKKPEVPRKGKSHLTLLDLKQAQKLGRGKPITNLEDNQEENKSLPSTSRTSATGRPARQSASRFKSLLSSVVDSQSVSSDDEEDAPRAKRSRTTSTASSRRRLNSDSDQSSVSEDAMKYRERRDRNNLSSKRSRQKRKVQRLKKQEELSELEEENARLRLKAEELDSVLTRVKAAWADYLAHMTDNDKDRGDEQ